LNLGGVHLKTIFGEDEAKIFDSVDGEVAFVGTTIETILTETSEYLADMSDVIFRGIGVDQDVIEIDSDSDV
jgi:hypothetical protein